jgi:transaldolase
MPLSSLRIKLFADGADLPGMIEAARNPAIRGFTTNPTLMRKAGVADYEAFARAAIAAIPDRPLSFEVFSDELEEMEAQARRIAGWGPHVYVKLPITNTRGHSIIPLLPRLAAAGVKCNVTAIMTLAQLEAASAALADAAPCCLSIFAGRIADTGLDPVPVMRRALEIMAPHPHQELIWASPREVLNLVQADAIGCHIITMTGDLLAKLGSLGKDLERFSLETVQMFRNDAVAAGYSL